MNIIFSILLLSCITIFAYEEKCVGPLDPNAQYKISAPFKDGTYDFTYNTINQDGKKYICFAKVKDTDDAIDFVASQPNRQTFEQLKRYVKQSLSKNKSRNL